MTPSPKIMMQRRNFVSNRIRIALRERQEMSCIEEISVTDRQATNTCYATRSASKIFEQANSYMALEKLEYQQVE